MPATKAPPSLGTQRTDLFVRILGLLALLFLFLVSIKLLESGIKVLGSDYTDNLFEGVSNPIAGLAAGILATVLVQSSSVSTAFCANWRSSRSKWPARHPAS